VVQWVALREVPRAALNQVCVPDRAPTRLKAVIRAAAAVLEQVTQIPVAVAWADLLPVDKVVCNTTYRKAIIGLIHIIKPCTMCRA
jgi:hypothetical protein